MKIFRHKAEFIYRRCTRGPMEMHFTYPKRFMGMIRDALSKTAGKKAFGSKKAILQKVKLCLNQAIERIINVDSLNVNTRLAQRD